MLFKKDFGSSVDFMIVGLGNPGDKYDNTRHNAGFITIDAIAKEYGINMTKLKYKALIGDGNIGGKKVILMKPQTFMNLSGQAVVEAMNFYKLSPEQVCIIMDDISLDVGKMRIRRKGSAGTHNGMKNIIALSGAQNFPRIKIGVGDKPNPNYDLAAWVLSKFTKDERAELDKCAEKSCDAVKLIMNGQIDEAMNRYNS